MTKLTKAEEKQLEKIDAALNWRFAVSVKDHFNKVGKLNAFANAALPEEQKRQKELLGAVLFGDSELPKMQIHDIFVAVARRASNDDQALAALLPAQLTASDAALLEKCELTSLSMLLKLKLAI